MYLALRVNREGKVVDAIAEQVNLSVLGTAAAMKKLRDTLEESATKVAWTWTFAPPTTGPLASNEDWTVHVPVNFNIAPAPFAAQPRRESLWETYVPGPVTSIPWQEGSIDPQMPSSDAMAAGDMRTDGVGLSLVTGTNPG